MPLHLAARGGHSACVERLLSTPGIDVNIKDKVSCLMFLLIWENSHHIFATVQPF